MRSVLRLSVPLPGGRLPRCVGARAPQRLSLMMSTSAESPSSTSRAEGLDSAVQGKIREQVHPTIKGRRRFYEGASVRPVPPGEGEGASPKFEVTLDGRALKSPGRRPMHVESEALAWGIALEWDAQTGKRGIEPSTMPLMSLTSTWLDQTAGDRGLVIKNVGKYLATDTACFYAEPALRQLRKRQEKAFEPLHEWMSSEWGCPLATTDEVFRLKHPPRSVARVLAMVHALDDPALTALQCAVMECKSLVVALAVVLRRMKPAKAEFVSRLEEEFQIEQWGLVEGGHDMDIVAAKVQLASASAFLHLLDGDQGHARRLDRLKQALLAHELAA
eukprot:CAMPEP_0172587868 /NCGR_PEP_ID=MMETSP1068-20121228/6861_1 /TAXON_ID=35684 /ORGANISM="Pseudopedinella elastica, Strain CCMP716" /LENGTH=331 /DNA_ID=CAMNT_0013383029 /DNA_START=73 /DNA_END=1068 /DNA_ORIENTATION=-